MNRRKQKRLGLFRRMAIGALRVVADTASWTTASLLGGAAGNAYEALDATKKLIQKQVSHARRQANEILAAGLRPLQAHCRHLERNHATARACVEGLDALVVCTGIALHPDTGDQELDLRIKEEWDAWLRECTTDGRNMYNLQEMLFREVVVAGEALTVQQNIPELAREGKIPIRILPLDSDWIDDQAGGGSPEDGVTRVQGIDVDAMGRPLNYHLGNPSRVGLLDSQVVPADQVNHIFEKRRALQLRGEPWFAPVIEQLILEKRLVEVELYAAEQSAAPAIAITSEDHDELDEGDEDPQADSDDPAQLLRPGSTFRLLPGERVSAISHTRPSQQIAPFRRMIRGDVAAAMRIPTCFLDRDYSRANYSSMRASMLDQQRLLAPVREWFGHQTVGFWYKKVLPFILMKLGVTRQVRDKYELLPDEVPYVDPLKDSVAQLIDIYGGLNTYEASISGRGGDRREVWRQRELEQKEIEESGLQIGLPSQIQLSINVPNESQGVTDESEA